MSFMLEDAGGALFELGGTFRPDQWSVGGEGGELERAEGSRDLVSLGDGLPAPARFVLVGTLRAGTEGELRLKGRDLLLAVRGTVKVWRSDEVYLPVANGSLRVVPLRANRADARISFDPLRVFWRDAGGLEYPF